VIFQKNLGAGILFIQDHHLMDALLSILGKDLTTGDTAIQDIIDGARELGAAFNVYRGRVADATSPGAGSPEFALGEIQTVLNFLLVQLDKTIPRENRKGFDFDFFIRSSLEMAENTVPRPLPPSSVFRAPAGAEHRREPPVLARGSSPHPVLLENCGPATRLPAGRPARPPSKCSRKTTTALAQPDRAVLNL
jgi:hypothetical protein